MMTVTFPPVGCGACAEASHRGILASLQLQCQVLTELAQSPKAQTGLYNIPGTLLESMVVPSVSVKFCTVVFM